MSVNYLSAVIFDEQILALAGICSSGAGVSTVESYSFHTNQWSTIKSMRTKVWSHCSYALNGKVFVIGGYYNTIEMYDPSTSVWTLRGKLNKPRSNFGVVKL